MAARTSKTQPKVRRRELPANVALERELLGALFASEECDAVFEKLDEKDFWDELHAKLYTAIKAAWQQGKPYQSGGFLVEVIRHWRTDDKLVANQILKDGGMPAHFDYYCKTLRELRRKRATWHISEQMTKAAEDPKTDSATWAAKTSDWLEKLGKVKP